MVCYYKQYITDTVIHLLSKLGNSKYDVYSAMLVTMLESGSTSDSVLLRVRSSKLRLHPQTP